MMAAPVLKGMAALACARRSGRNSCRPTPSRAAVAMASSRTLGLGALVNGGSASGWAKLSSSLWPSCVFTTRGRPKYVISPHG